MVRNSLSEKKKGYTMNIKKWSIIIAALFLSGCAGMSFSTMPVDFENPYEMLNIVPVEPTEEEATGVVLRIQPPSSGNRVYQEDNTIFARIKEDKGMRVHITMQRTDFFITADRDEFFIVDSKTDIEKGGTIHSRSEQSTRGAVVNLFEGFHDSKIGTFKIRDWQRSPMYTEDAVRIGDVWEYSEVMDVEMKSFWVKDIAPEPYVLNATSTLTGFALVNDRRCAVIETHATQTKSQRLKAFWQQLEFSITTTVIDQTYLDYITGTILAQVVTSESATESANPMLNDTGKSQSIIRNIDGI